MNQRGAKMNESPRELSLRLHRAANLCPNCAGLLNETAEYLRSLRLEAEAVESGLDHPIIKTLVGYMDAQPGSGMNSRGETPGFIRALAAYPDGFKRPTMRRYWVSEGLEPDTDAIVAGINRWEAHWLQYGYRVAMDKFLWNEMWKQEPPKGKTNDHRAAKSEREFTDNAASDMPVHRPKGT